MCCNKLKNAICGNNDTARVINRVIKKVSFLLAAFCLVCIVLIFILAVFSKEWRVDISLQGFERMAEFWHRYRLFGKSFLLSATLYVATANLEKFINAEEYKALSELRSKLTVKNKMAIHNYLLDPEDKELSIGLKDKDDDFKDTESVELLDYLGTLELGAIMLKRGVISKKEFKNQFYYRLENIRANETLMNHIDDVENKKYYEYFEYVLEEMGIPADEHTAKVQNRPASPKSPERWTLQVRGRPIFGRWLKK